MTRALLVLIYNVLVGLYDFWTNFWGTWGTYLQVISIIRDIVTESIWLLYYVCYEFWWLIYWWDHTRTDPTFISDVYNVIFFLRCGFEDYVLLNGDPENIGRAVYYPAGFVYRILQGLESVTFTLNEWYLNVIKALNNIPTWDAIRSAILTWLPDLEDIATWWSDWVTNVTQAIANWWAPVALTVQGWIATATAGLSGLLTTWNDFWTITWPDFTGKLDDLKSAWDTFWTDTLPTLLDVNWAVEWWKSKLTEVSDLIDSKLKTWFPFYDDLAELWETIALFFTNPLNLLASKLEDWFWGEEEP